MTGRNWLFSDGFDEILANFSLARLIVSTNVFLAHLRKRYRISVPMEHQRGQRFHRPSKVDHDGCSSRIDRTQNRDQRELLDDPPVYSAQPLVVWEFCSTVLPGASNLDSSA